MSRTVIFDSPFLLGFDDMRALIERVGRSNDSYPPYNVEALGPDHIRISVAVAGFAREQLRVEVKGAQLMISAMKDRADGEEREYLHRGIGMRSFNRAFVLSDGFEVRSASLAYGLLNVDLIRLEAADDVRIIRID